MKTTLASLIGALALLATTAAFAAPAAAPAHDQAAMKAEAAKADAAKPLKGEIVDMGCYLGHEAKGPDHASCATKCIANGMPMGLLTSDGTVYLLTMSHADAEPFNKAKTLAAKTVTITGPVHERGGVKSVEVEKITE